MTPTTLPGLPGLPGPSPSAEHDTLIAEAGAFDRQIDERMANGHIPDLRRVQPCDWFYNNAWRRPEYVALDFGEQFELIRDAIREHTSASTPRVLEVGCGPGYLSLELARAGFDVVGLDLSPRCIEIAEQVAGDDPWAAERGALHYLTADLFTGEPLDTSPEARARALELLRIASFDAVVFLGALHHFGDQYTVMRRVRELLAPSGVIVVHEPARDRVERGHAVFSLMAEGIISAGGHFHTDIPLPGDDAACEAEIDRRYRRMRYEDEAGEKLQSANDNEAGWTEMSAALEAAFECLDFQWRYAFFHEVIGGLRYDEATNARLARFLREMDRRLVQTRVLPATEFFFVGGMTPNPAIATTTSTQNGKRF